MHTAAFSTMAEVIAQSTQHMSEGDLRTIAVHLKDQENESFDSQNGPSETVMAAGKAICFDDCRPVTPSDGSGVPRFFAPPAGSGKVNQADPTTTIRVILEGTRSVPTRSRPLAFVHASL
ncbi:hypothetical protein ACQKP1_23460 [Allorhizobium sp. NPDC080224]|uniref:hypothetical protein n=1 Tax=Allorhizobium sp. NPDC080224 TaxID=3390547 RepID=UPI003D06BBAC